MADFDDSKRLVSVYNEAQLQIMRLNNIWTKCHNYAQHGNLSAYKWQLDRAWIELSADAEKLNKKYYFDAIELINSSIAKSKNNDSLYNLLIRKEIFLKLLQEECGKGSKRKREGGSWF